MADLKSVAILGATGDLGEVLIPALLAAGFLVTCITRPGSKATFPADVTTKSAAYTDVPALTAALRGQHALVEAFNPAASAYQESILQAALAAGVHHIVTPDFSGDTFNANIDEVLIFEPKRRAQAHLENIVAASGGTLSWTAIIVGPWYDWAIDTGIFWINRETKTIMRYGTGEQKYCMSRRALCGEALVKVLQAPEKFHNRPAYFASHTVSTNELVALVREDLKLEEWSVTDVSIDGYLEVARRLWDEDTSKGVENRLASRAYPMLGTLAMMHEENRYGANFNEKLELGWDEGMETLKENLRRLLTASP